MLCRAAVVMMFVCFQVCEIIESPLFLKLNPMTKHTDVSDTQHTLVSGGIFVVVFVLRCSCVLFVQLPVSVFESVIDIINGEVSVCVWGI